MRAQIKQFIKVEDKSINTKQRQIHNSYGLKFQKKWILFIMFDCMKQQNMKFFIIKSKKVPLQGHVLASLIIVMLLSYASAVCHPTNCDTCVNGSDYDCQSCNTGYIVSGGVCCDQYCTTCTNSSNVGVCTACINSYAVRSSTKSCRTCSSLINSRCIECSSETSCTKCVAGYFARDDDCLYCRQRNCQLCSSSYVCAICKQGYKVYDSRCCDQTCKTCSDRYDSDLSPSYYATCSSCANRTRIVSNSKCRLCSQFISDCLECTSSSTCTLCSPTFALSQQQCKPCSQLMANCFNCTSSSVCTQCVNDAYILNNAYRCVTCSTYLTGCFTCNSSTVCTSCLNNLYTLNLTSNQCLLCSQVILYCSNCSAINVCINCQSNYFAINSMFGCSRCQNLMLNCLQCNSSSICISCNNSFYVINSTSNLCVLCGAYLPLCITCASRTFCTSCQFNPNIILNNGSCVKCGVVFPSCLNCSTATKCTVCEKYYLASSGECLLCRNVMNGCAECTSKTVCIRCGSGHIVLNGCSSTPGCLAINANSYISSCTACDPDVYQPTPVKGACICLKGHLAGDYCTQIVGCTKIVRSNTSIDTCIACDSYLKLKLENGLCVCQPFYYLNGSTCTQICGDGVLINLPCDDGNLINGDGCSSTCQIERGYGCKFDSIINQSRCIYGGTVKLQLVCVYKGEEDNTAQIILTTTPFIPNILKSTHVVSFNMSKNCSLLSTSFVEKNIILMVEYQQDIEGAYADITIQYDDNYIVSPDESLPIKLSQCNGDRLYYSDSSSKNTKAIIDMVVKILSALVLLVWLVGSYSHKMIGVETLHTFQFIFVPQALATRYLPVFVYFSGLSDILNIYQTKFTSSSTVSAKEQARLQYSADFIYNSSVVALIQFIAIAVYVTLMVYQKIKKRTLIDGQQPNKAMMAQNKKDCTQILFKFKQFLYDFLVFPSFIGFFINIAFSLMLHSTTNYEKNYSLLIQTPIIFFSFFCLSVIFFNEWKHFFVSDIKKYKLKTNMKNNYVSFYLTFFLLVCITLEASLLSLVPNSLFILFLLFLINTVILIVYRPYTCSIHNFSLVVNQLGVLLNLCWLISQQYVYFPKEQEQLIALALIGWMVIILIFAVIRIIYEIKQKRVEVKEMKTTEQQQKKKNIKQFESRIIKSILKESMMTGNPYLLQSQVLRARILQEREYEQRRKEHAELVNKIGIQINLTDQEQSESKISPLITFLKKHKK